MFSHPAAVFGFIVAGIGWLLLLFGAGAGGEVLGRQIINFHSTWIAQSAILTGGLFIVAGVCAGAGERIREALLFHPQIAANAGAFDKAEKARKKASWDYINTGKRAKTVPDADSDDDVVTAERRLAELQMKR